MKCTYSNDYSCLHSNNLNIYLYSVDFFLADVYFERVMSSYVVFYFEMISICLIDIAEWIVMKRSVGFYAGVTCGLQAADLQSGMKPANTVRRFVQSALDLHFRQHSLLVGLPIVQETFFDLGLKHYLHIRNIAAQAFVEVMLAHKSKMTWRRAVLCPLILAFISFTTDAAGARRDLLESASASYIFRPLQWSRLMKNAGLASVEVSSVSQPALATQPYLRPRKRKGRGRQRGGLHGNTVQMETAEAPVSPPAPGPISPPSPEPSPAPVPPGPGGCPPSPSECTFFFDGAEGSIPAFRISDIENAPKDAYFAPTIEAPSMNGATYTVVAANSAKASYSCGPTSLPDDDQFYATQDRVQIRTFQTWRNASTYKDQYVKVVFSAVEITSYNMVINLNPADGSTLFPDSQRCITFKLV